MYILFGLIVILNLHPNLAFERNDTFRYSLDGRWTAVNSNKSILINATVPGGIYSDLLENNVLLYELFYRFNDVEYRWVSKDNWTYSIDFDVEDEILQKREVLLVFYGLDTVADIYLNEKLVDSVDNMFVRYEYSVKDILLPSDNHLEVRFTSPMPVALERFNKQAEDYIIWPDCTTDSDVGECHINFLRKMQCSFSWDWGPAFPSMGIWKSVEIVAFDSALVRDVLVDYNSDTSNLTFNVFLETGVGEGDIAGTLQVVFNNDSSISVQKHLQLTLNNDSSERSEIVSIEIPKSSVELWYPNGLGKQQLYTVQLSFQSEDEEETSSILFNYGLRDLKLIQEPASDVNESLGLTFYFKVNGINVFAKGANWIPGHILPELSADYQRVRSLLQAAKDVGMNMLRVWGGGLYESDTFYDIADELGIMIWQDFTFASALYPSSESFLTSVAVEARQQVRRLHYHPSLAAWSGNNENEIVLRTFFYGSEVYREDYIKLFADTIMNTVKEIDPSRPFVMSSPSNGDETIAEGYIANNPTSALYGDNHFYNYEMNGWDPTQYMYTRFASEYGFQSLPSFQTIELGSVESDWDITSNFSLHRQHHPGGNDEIMSEILKNLPYVESESPEGSYKTFIFLSQINQAMSVRTETEFYRRSRSLFNENGEGLTMGTLYWQLNDVWQCPSWSSIDFNGRWKMLHYYAKNFFAPLILSPHIDSENVLYISTVTDLLDDISESTLRISIYSYDTFEPLFTNNFQVNISSQSSQIIYSLDLNNSNFTRENALLYTELFSVSGETIAPPSFLPLASLAEATNLIYGNPGVVNVSSSGILQNEPGKKEFTITLRTDNIALFVWLEVRDISGTFSENGFAMVSEYKTVSFTTPSDLEYDVVMTKLFVDSLNNHLKA